MTRRFHGTVLFLSADAVEAHQLGGFKVGVGLSLRKCRDCMGTDIDIQIWEDMTTQIKGKKEILYTLNSFCFFFDVTKMTLAGM